MWDKVQKGSVSDAKVADPAFPNSKPPLPPLTRVSSVPKSSIRDFEEVELSANGERSDPARSHKSPLEVEARRLATGESVEPIATLTNVDEIDDAHRGATNTVIVLESVLVHVLVTTDDPTRRGHDQERSSIARRPRSDLVTLHASRDQF
jgi:hypothetical protein